MRAPKKFVSNVFLNKAISAIAIAMVCVMSAMAQPAWPDRTIKVIVPYTPGGGTDAVTRHLLDKVTAETKWSMIVDNKPGGNGNVGLDIVAKSKPDGYTLLLGQTGEMVINTIVGKETGDTQSFVIKSRNYCQKTNIWTFQICQ